MLHYFTFTRASRLLSDVELLIRDTLFLKAEYQRAAASTLPPSSRSKKPKPALAAGSYNPNPTKVERGGSLYPGK